MSKNIVEVGQAILCLLLAVFFVRYRVLLM